MAKGRISEKPVEKVKLDQHDRKILFHLSENARAPLSVLAKKIRLSRETVDYRIRRLIKEGVISIFAPIIDITHFGFYTYHVFFIINDITDKRKQMLIKSLIEHPNTKAVMEYSDKWDIEWALIAKNINDFDRTLTKITTEFSDIIIEKSKLETIDGYKSVHLPFEKYSSAVIEFERKNSRKLYRPDSMDIKLLRLLSENARSSSYELAGKLGLSANAVRYRLKNMERSRIIKQCSIIVDLAKLDLHWHTVCLTVKTLDNKNESKLRQYVLSNPSIIRAVKVLGPWDLMINVVDQDIRNFHRTIKEIQGHFIDILSTYQCLTAYQEHIYIPFPEIITAA
jgi:DNA-binding Lrp family transcriptional regulator